MVFASVKQLQLIAERLELLLMVLTTSSCHRKLDHVTAESLTIVTCSLPACMLDTA